MCCHGGTTCDLVSWQVCAESDHVSDTIINLLPYPTSLSLAVCTTSLSHKIHFPMFLQPDQICLLRSSGSLLSIINLATLPSPVFPFFPPQWPPLILSEEPNSPTTPSLPPPPQITISNSRKKSVQRTAIIAISVCLPLLLAAAVGLLLYVKVYPALADSSPKLQKLGRLKGLSHSRQIEGKDGDLGSGGADEGKVGAGSRAVTASGRAAAIASARSSRRRKRFGVVMPPTTSAYSTLVITDIQVRMCPWSWPSRLCFFTHFNIHGSACA